MTQAFNLAQLANNVNSAGKLAADTGLVNAVPIANGGLALTTTPTNGKIPIGNGTNYTLANLTAGTGISIVNAAGAITINGTASAGPQAQVFLSSGTFTVPTGITNVQVILFGGGGGGGGGLYGNGGGGSGGQGGMGIAYVTGISGTVTVTVGAGGNGGGNNAYGAAGGTTSFGSFATATGGAGGGSFSSGPADVANGAFSTTGTKITYMPASTPQPFGTSTWAIAHGGAYGSQSMSGGAGGNGFSGGGGGGGGTPVAVGGIAFGLGSNGANGTSNYPGNGGGVYGGIGNTSILYEGGAGGGTGGVIVMW